MKWKVLVSAPYAQPVLDFYRTELARANCEMVVPAVRERLEEADLLKVIAEIDGVICGDDRFTPKVFEHAKKLKVISKWGTGIDSIDLEAAKAKGVPVRNTPNAFSEPVADTVFGYMLMFARKLLDMNREMHSGVWSKPQLVALGELTLGVVGVGNCGKAVIRRANAFGMKVLGTDIVDIDKNYIASSGIRMVSLEELLRSSDVISLNCTLTPSSMHLMNTKTFGMVKNGAFLINTCRGPVVQQSALVDALRSKRIAGAALDVFEDEPLPKDCPLLQFENCWMAPHSANSSPKAAWRVHENTIKNLIEELNRSESSSRAAGNA